MKAVILAGGYGKRLRPFTDNMPKNLIEVGGKPIVEWQLMWLKSHGISEFVILAGYMSEKLIEFVDSKKKEFAIKVDYSVEKEPLGTAGALKQAEHLIDGDQFLMINGDIITNMNIKQIKLQSEQAAMALVPLRSPFGVIDMKADKIVKFVEKPVLKDYWINAGVYLIDSRIVATLPAKGDLEKTSFVELARKEMLKGVKFDEIYWRSVDSIKDMEEVSSDLKRGAVESRG